MARRDAERDCLLLHDVMIAQERDRVGVGNDNITALVVQFRPLDGRAMEQARPPAPGTGEPTETLEDFNQLEIS